MSWDDEGPNQCRMDGTPIERQVAAPAPAEMDDVAVLRRASEICAREGWPGNLSLPELARRIEAARRPPTPLELIREYDRIQTEAWPSGPDEMPMGHPGYKLWVNVRRAIAAAEKENK